MKTTIGFLFLSVCMVMMLIAGCTGQAPATSSSGSPKPATSLKVTESNGNLIIEIHNGAAAAREYRTVTVFSDANGASVKQEVSVYPLAAPFTTVSATIPIPPGSTGHKDPQLSVMYEGAWTNLAYEKR